MTNKDTKNIASKPKSPDDIAKLVAGNSTTPSDIQHHIKALSDTYQTEFDIAKKNLSMYIEPPASSASSASSASIYESILNQVKHSDSIIDDLAKQHELRINDFKQERLEALIPYDAGLLAPLAHQAFADIDNSLDIFHYKNQMEPKVPDFMSNFTKIENSRLKQREQLIADQAQKKKEMYTAPIESLGNKLDERLSTIAENSKEFTESLKGLIKSQLLLAEFIKQSSDESSKLSRTGIKQNKWVLFISVLTLGVSAYSTFKTSAPIEDVAAQSSPTPTSKPASTVNTQQILKVDDEIEPHKVELQTEPKPQP
jgi:hypothetical protein